MTRTHTSDPQMRLSVVAPGIILTCDLGDDRKQARKNLDRWAATGIAHIVDCRAERTDRQFVHDIYPEIRYTHVPVKDDGLPKSDHWFEAGVGDILEERERGRLSLVHCAAGINRGPSMGFAAMLALGWDPVAALDKILSRRPIVGLGYAYDALAWHCRRTELDEETVDRLVLSVQGWLKANYRERNQPRITAGAME